MSTKVEEQGRDERVGRIGRHVSHACALLITAGTVLLAVQADLGWQLNLAAFVAACGGLFGVLRRDTASAKANPGADHEPSPRLVTDLALRAPLIAAIEDDLAVHPGGTIGIFEFADFDRLHAFDPGLADRALATLSDRVARMVGVRRPVGQVGRARIAIWFGATIDAATARAELDAIGYALATAIDVGGGAIVPEFRLGIAHFSGQGDTADLLVARAKTALSDEVTALVGEAVSPEIALRSRFTLEQDLRQAIANAQLALAFQPLIDGVHQRIVGAEALLRWEHPKLGAVPPSEFIPIAEGAGLAEELGMWALNAACRAARGWQRLGMGDLTVAVNLSARQLDRDDLPQLVERTLARHRLAPALLELELTETVAAGDVKRIGDLFARLRASGVRIAIDDFGTGYSSLSYLRALTFDKLKIDREFVTDVDTRRDSQAICQSLIALGRGLGIRVLAEGVERREEYEWLRRHGCALFQGYLFSRPLFPAEFERFVRDGAGIVHATALSPAALQTQIRERFSA